MRQDLFDYAVKYILQSLPVVLVSGIASTTASGNR
jgi:hypothetical protein